MEKYIGVKLIEAETCTRGEHSISKGFDKVLTGKAEDEGYRRLDDCRMKKLKT